MGIDFLSCNSFFSIKFRSLACGDQSMAKYYDIDDILTEEEVKLLLLLLLLFSFVKSNNLFVCLFLVNFAVCSCVVS